MKTKIKTNYFLISLCLLMSTHLCTAKKNTVIATINTGPTPTGIAITANNRYAYIANGNYSYVPDQTSIIVLDLYFNTVKTIINDSNFNEPFTITISPNGRYAYVTNYGNSTVSIIDTQTNMVADTIYGFYGPIGMAVTLDNKYGYVINYFSDLMSVVDLTTNTTIGYITVGLFPQGLTLSPDGKYLYVVNYVDGNEGTGTMSIIEIASNTVVDTVTGFTGPDNVAITPDGKYAYVTNFGSNEFREFATTVSVVKLRRHHHSKIVKTIDIWGIQPTGIVISPDGKYAYVANYNTLSDGTSGNSNSSHVMSASTMATIVPGQGTFNIIDIKKNKVITPTIPVGHTPLTIALTSDGKFAYVTNNGSNTMNIIQLKK